MIGGEGYCRAHCRSKMLHMSLSNDITVLNKDLPNMMYALLALPTIERQSNDNAIFCNQYTGSLLKGIHATPLNLYFIVERIIIILAFSNKIPVKSQIAFL